MISSQDFDRLSAYVDNQLSLKEKAALEARLAREPELKATLDGLRQTVSALRSLPVVKPPRNFMLSARQVGAAGQAQRRFFPALRLATSLAALALVLVFAGDFIAGRAPALNPAAAPARSTSAERNMVVSEVAPPAVAMGAAPAPTLALTPVMDQSPEGTTAAGGGATGGSVAATPAPEADTPMAAAVLAASPATTDTTAPAAAAPVPAPGGEQPTASEPAAVARLAPTETPGGETSNAVTSAPAAKLAPTEVPAPLTPTETLAPPAAPTVDTYLPQISAQAAAPAEPPVSGVPWRLVEVGLIGLTLVLAVMTWLMRRR